MASSRFAQERERELWALTQDLVRCADVGVSTEASDEKDAVRPFVALRGDAKQARGAKRRDKRSD